MLLTHIIELDSPVPTPSVRRFVRDLVQSSSVVRAYVDDEHGRRLAVAAPSSVSEQDVRSTVATVAARWVDAAADPAGPELDERAFDQQRWSPLRSAGGQTADVAAELFDRGWLVPLPAQEVGLVGPLADLVEAFDQMFVRDVGAPVEDVRRAAFTPILPAELAGRMGYLHDGHSHLMAVVPTGHAGGVPDHVLQSAPCLKIYCIHADRALGSNVAYTVRGSCFRDERKQVFLIQRLRCFSQRELVFVGDRDFVRSARESVLDATWAWLRELGIGAELQPALDPFFLAREDASDPEVPSPAKVEVQAAIPSASSTVSIASFDLHGSYFGERLAITAPGGGAAWSGCLGIGLERAAWAFLQQYGTKVRSWPSTVRELLP